MIFSIQTPKSAMLKKFALIPYSTYIHSLGGQGAGARTKTTDRNTPGSVLSPQEQAGGKTAYTNQGGGSSERPVPPRDNLMSPPGKGVTLDIEKSPTKQTAEGSQAPVIEEGLPRVGLQRDKTPDRPRATAVGEESELANIPVSVSGHEEETLKRKIATANAKRSQTPLIKNIKKKAHQVLGKKKTSPSKGGGVGETVAVKTRSGRVSKVRRDSDKFYWLT